MGHDKFSLIAALKKIIARNEHFQRLYTKKDYMQRKPLDNMKNVFKLS